jgi:hypothetical protein
MHSTKFLTVGKKKAKLSRKCSFLPSVPVLLNCYFTCVFIYIYNHANILFLIFSDRNEKKWLIFFIEESIHRQWQ